MESITTKKQAKEFTIKNHTDKHGDLVDMYIEVRWDDNCSNGQNSFAITADIYKAGRKSDRSHIGGGCCHDEIIRAFPSLKRAIDFHLFDTRGPMHYIANTLYHASDKDCYGLKEGEVSRSESKIKFGDFPMLFDVDSPMLRMIKDNFDFSSADIEECIYKGEYDFSPKYRIKGYEQYCRTQYSDDKQWYNCSHGDRKTLESFLECLKKYPVDVITIPTEYSEGKEPDLKAARSCANWPNAELKDFTEENLKARLPDMLKELKGIIESLGMTY